MSIIRAIALLVGLAALVAVVVRVRKPHTFPIATLVREWFQHAPSLGQALVGIGAGIASVVIVPIIGLSKGWGKVMPIETISVQWITLAVAGVAVKTAWVFFEELIFRGAVLSQLRRWAGTASAVVISALIFAVAHSGRSLVAATILFVDGVGFACAFAMTRSLWVPLLWHLSKNVSVWFFLGNGTIDLAPGPFTFEQLGLGSGGGTGGTGLLDLCVTIIIVGAAIWSLGFLEGRAQEAGRSATDS